MNGSGGGVGIYVKKSLKLKRRADLEHTDLECLWLEILVKNSKSFLFGCFCRPPETSKYLHKEYNAFVSENLRSIDMEQKEVILMGDFNVNYKDETRGDSNLYSVCKVINKLLNRLLEQQGTAPR